jgi:hypothetical protein
MFLLMRRLIAASVLTVLALCAVVSPALARTPKPTITSVTPTKVAVGGVLTLKGKNFRSGVRNNRVFFVRASDGKSVRARPRKATKTRIDVLVPNTLTNLLDDDGLGQGGKKETRFRLMVFTNVLGPKTALSRSPLISPPGANVPGTPNSTPPPPPDCDNDGTPDATDTDDDNDGLSDDLENSIKTNSCAKDTDGDGVDDAFEYYSSLDLNGSPTYAGKRPYPNPLDATDATKDFDGDGMTELEEFGAAVKSGNATSQPLAYSDGNQTSAATGGPGGRDLDNNGRITDEEKDVDGDGLANWLELSKNESTTTAGGNCAFTGPPSATNIFTNCGGVINPNGNTFRIPTATATGAPSPAFLTHTDFLDPDTDGDGINDGADDQDHDDISNIQEALVDFTDPQDPCQPNTDARTCPTHPTH